MSKLGNIFKEKLNSRKFELQDAQWNDLEKMLDANQVKPFGWFNQLWLLPIVAITALFGGWYFLSNDIIPEQSFQARILSNKTNTAGVIDPKTGKQITEPIINCEIEEQLNNDVHEVEISSINELDEENSSDDITKDNMFLGSDENYRGIREQPLSKHALAASLVKEQEVETSGKQMINVQSDIIQGSINGKKHFDEASTNDDNSLLETSITERTVKNESHTGIHMSQVVEFEGDGKEIVYDKSIVIPKKELVEELESESRSVTNNNTVEGESLGMNNYANINVINDEELAKDLKQSSNTIIDEAIDRDITLGSKELTIDKASSLEMLEQVMETESSELSYMPFLPTALNLNLEDMEMSKLQIQTNPDRKFKFSVGAYGGVMQSSKYLKSNVSTFDTYITRRSEEEKSRLAFNGGVDINLHYKRWTLSTGINYHQQGEKTDYSRSFYQWANNDSIAIDYSDNSYWEANESSFWVLEDDNYWTTYDTTLVYWNEALSTYDTTSIQVQEYVINNIDTMRFALIDSSYITVIDTLTMVYTDSVYKTVNDINMQTQYRTTLSYIEIPLLLGVEVPINRWVINIKTGAGIGMLREEQLTYLLDNQSNIAKVSSVQLNSIQISYLIKLGFNYYINTKTGIYIEPHYRLNLKNVFSTSNYSQKYYNVGVNLGVVYSL